MAPRRNFEYFTDATRNGLLMHGGLSLIYVPLYLLAERRFFNPDPNPFLYATAYASLNNMWRIFVRREPKWSDNVGVFMGAATAYWIYSSFY